VKFNRMISLALCLGVAFLFLAGSALAQVTAVSALDLRALQSGKALTIYTLTNSITRTMAVARSTGQNFFLDVTLPTGFQYTGAAANLPEAADVTSSPANVTVTVFSQTSTRVRYLLQVVTTFVEPAVISINTGVGGGTGAWTINDTLGTLSGTSTVTVNITVETFDAATGTPVDVGTNSVPWIRAQTGLAGAIGPTTATIDVGQPSGRTNFLEINGDLLDQDNGGSVAITLNTVNNAAGVQYTIAATDTINLTLRGNLSGIASFTFAGECTAVVHTVTAAERTAGAAVLVIPGTNGCLPTTPGTIETAVFINVDNTTQLDTRTLTLQINSVIAFNAANNSSLAGPSTFTVWDNNGTVLLSNWSNANPSAFKSRYYIWNSTATANADVSVRVFTAPLPGSGNSAQLGSTLVLTPKLGAVSGMTLRLQEDILTPLGVTTLQAAGPDGNFNVIVEITILASNVTGYGQVFTLDAGSGSASQLAFGTVPLTKIQ
jgi:hypothetical protein